MAQTTRMGAPETAGQQLAEDRSRARLVAAGGLLGALAATSCCILPLVLFSVGISGA